MVKNKNSLLCWLLLGIGLVGSSSCSDNPSQSLNQTLTNGAGKSLIFVASGTCYGGGVTTTTPSQTVAAFDLNTGSFHHLVVDYGILSPGDSPVAIQEYDADNMLVVVENTLGRRVDLVRKDGSSFQTYLVNSTALNAVLRSVRMASDGSVLISKSSAVEKFNSARGRVTQGANPYVNAPAGSCATSTTLISSIEVYPNDKILIAHAAATPNNKISLISSTGYAAAGDCLAATAGPTTTALPSGAVFHPSTGKTLVAFGSTTTASNFIYSYNVNYTSNSISGATAVYTDTSIVNGPSAMTVDSDTGNVYVASGTSTFNTVEAFTFSGTTLTRIGSKPFIGPNIYTRCVSSMRVMGYPQ
ncbi:MAG: hypothetical protein AB7F86_08375 [Bdellovibrionales bacterium]